MSDIKEVRGTTIVCKNTSLICTELIVIDKSVCLVYEDCPTWPCQITPDCSVSYQQGVDCVEWDCKDSNHGGLNEYAWLGYVTVAVLVCIIIILFLVKKICKSQRRGENATTEPRAQAIQEEDSNFCLLLKKMTNCFKNVWSCCFQDGRENGVADDENGRYQSVEEDLGETGLAEEELNYGSLDTTPRARFGKYDTRSLPEESDFFKIDF